MALVLWEMASRCEVVGGRSIAPGFPGAFLLLSSPYRDAAHPRGGTGPDLGWLGSPLGCRERAADAPPWLPALCAAARGGWLRGRGAGRDPRAHLVQPPLQAGRPPSLLRAGAGDGKQTRQEEPKLPPPPRPQALWVVFFQTTATGTRRLQPLTEPRPPSPPRATSRHLKWRVAKHLISCPAVSPCLPPSLPPSHFQLSPVPSLSHLLAIQTHRAARNSSPRRESCPDRPACPMLGGVAQMPRASFAPEPASQATLPHSCFTCICAQAGAGRSQASHLCNREFLLGLPRHGVALLEGPFLL